MFGFFRNVPEQKIVELQITFEEKAEKIKEVVESRFTFDAMYINKHRRTADGRRFATIKFAFWDEQDVDRFDEKIDEIEDAIRNLGIVVQDLRACVSHSMENKKYASIFVNLLVDRY